MIEIDPPKPPLRVAETLPERRGATQVTDASAVPEGTLLTVPAAPSSGGSGTAPIVAVNTVSWWKDPTILTTIGGALLALEPVVEDALREQTFNWKSFTLACILALGAYFRNRTNTVTR